MTKIEAVELTLSQWRKRVKGNLKAASSIGCPLCKYTAQDSRQGIDDCERCPMLNKWPLAKETNKKGTTACCVDKESAWASNVWPTLENDKLIVSALTKLLKELENEQSKESDSCKSTTNRECR